MKLVNNEILQNPRKSVYRTIDLQFEYRCYGVVWNAVFSDNLKIRYIFIKALTFILDNKKIQKFRNEILADG